MHDRLPPLNWLRAFEAAARHLSFTHAARELHLTQAAISKQVKLLELRLGEPLFVRRARSLELTRTGEAYLPKVRDAFQRLAAGTHEVFGERSGVLTLRCAVGFSVNWLAGRLPDYFRLHPDTGLRIVSSVWNEPVESGTVDLDILYGSGNWPGMRSDRLTWETITPVCSPGLLTGHNALREPADLANHSLLHVLGYEEGWGIWLREAGESGIDPGSGYQFDTSLLAFEVAAGGFGVALGRSSMAAAALASGRLVAPFDLQAPINEAFHLVSPAGGSRHSDGEQFRGWLLDQVNRERDAAAAAG